MGASKPHRSVVYFHGIGSPARHTSLSYFLDHFDIFGQRQKKEEIGLPRKFQYSAEILGDSILHTLSFARILKVSGKATVNRVIKTYEAYWVPEAGTGFGFFYAVYWLITRLFAPFKVLFSHWRAFPSIKLSYLHHLAEAPSTAAGDVQVLEKRYREFENWANRKRFPKGRYSDFLVFISESVDSDPAPLERMARAWRWLVFRRSLRLVSISISLYACLIGFLYSVTKSVLVLKAIFIHHAAYQTVLTLVTAIFILAAAFCIAWAFRRVFYEYVHDILFWTVSSERGKRADAKGKVIAYARSLLRQVVDNENCSECYIICHSLGSSIAMESILQEGLREKINSNNNDENKNLSKIKYVFTLGSPIDLIFYMFESDATFSHRYNRLVEEKRLSIVLPPFTYPSHKSNSKIVNFWSRFDPISSRVTSLRKSISERHDALVNIEVLPSGFPWPVNAHNTYFSDHRAMRFIYWVVMTGRAPPQEEVRSSDLNLFSAAMCQLKWASLCGLAFAITVAMFMLHDFGTPIIWASLASIMVLFVLLARKLCRDLGKLYQETYGEYLQETS